MRRVFSHYSVSSNIFHPALCRLIVYLLCLFFIYTPNLYNQTLTADKIYKKVTDAVVVIHAYDANGELAKQGSGVVINDKGYIVTNYHVLEGCEKLEVLHNKKLVPYIDIIGIDVEKDILILKIDKKKFPAIKIGDSKYLNIGQRIYAIGSPLGFENTISEGIISGLRSYEENQRNFIQITASISAGSSGGAIVNDKGELIGISTLTVKEGQNLNFAIPIDEILSVEIGSYSKNDAYKEFEWFAKGYDAYKKGDYQEAVKYLTNYIYLFPNDDAAFYNRGISKANLKEFKSAIQDFTKSIDLNPKNIESYFNRGNAKYYLEDYGEAIQDYNKVIEIDSNYVIAYYNRGNTRYKLKEYQKAISDYNKVIEINPDYASAYYERGKSKFILGNTSEAFQDYNKSIELNPNDANAYNLRGLGKFMLGLYDAAMQDFNKTIEIDPNNEFAYLQRGICKAKVEDYRGSIQDYNKAISIDPNNAEAFSGRGKSKAALKDFRGALQDYNVSIELNPYNANLYRERGLVKLLLKDYEEGCLDFSKAGELGLSEAYDLIKQYCNE